RVHRRTRRGRSGPTPLPSPPAIALPASAVTAHPRRAGMQGGTARDNSGSSAGTARGMLRNILAPVPHAPASPSDDGEVLRLLAAFRHGGPDCNAALDRLFPLVYAELRRAADYLLQRE